MTVPPNSSAPQPGWYPASDGSGRQQWWDGYAWTGHFNSPYPAVGSATRPQLSDKIPIYNPLIWLATLLPLVQILFTLGWNPVVRLRYIGSNHIPTVDPFSMFTPAYFLVLGSGLLGYAICALMAFLDWQRLRRDGVIRAFHWAWVFLNTAVYVVGRSIIVHQVAPRRGLAPVWVLIGVFVLSFVATSIKMAAVFSSMSATLPY
ncbi:DUF2510 domain-containing protein [Paenarthrobacter sp. Z7-10]|uniref:DUF2510 domain-containing protein n=1 Tax=Paenarthrobacter sp. Z7-10 TaxID=2787635 RepID=UPI0022A953CD|nr:DUF2510 domain-containing protein [Paenarthrobacter sp. Z7-10]MCZ2402004.1 DUF2510 domain-containing protein [Paenarthrobacter sp. Z7-10]